MPECERILVIRLSALGDLVLCFRAFAALRAAHPAARIALLTMPGLAGFARQMPWFDEVIVDTRPSWKKPAAWVSLLRAVRAFAPDRVYDLQGKFRQTLLYTLLGGPAGPVWSGAAPFCALPRPWPPRPESHFTDFIAAQLESAGVSMAVEPDTTWLHAPTGQFHLPDRYAVLIPGCAPTRPYKRWPASRYAALANLLIRRDILPVVIGTAAEAPVIEALCKACPRVRDLSERTSLLEVASLARHSVCVIGNDTGPTHLAAATGARTLTLMSEYVNASWAAPRGPNAICLQGDPLAMLAVADVAKILEPYIVIAPQELANG